MNLILFCEYKVNALANIETLNLIILFMNSLYAFLLSSIVFFLKIISQGCVGLFETCLMMLYLENSWEMQFCC